MRRMSARTKVRIIEIATNLQMHYAIINPMLFIRRITCTPRKLDGRVKLNTVAVVFPAARFLRPKPIRLDSAGGHRGY